MSTGGDRGDRLEVDRQDAPQAVGGDPEGEAAARLAMPVGSCGGRSLDARLAALSAK